jgi:hypothetical protein
MDRRAFVLGILGVAAAATTLSGTAEAAPLPAVRPETDQETRLEADYKPEVDPAATAEEAQFYYYRPRRVVYRRRRFYRPRYRRRVYYRPRRVYRRRYRRAYYW